MTARVALLALLAVVSRAHADPPGPEPTPLDLTNARVLASPGWPGALKPFLPPGRAVEPLALPLPPGPVLVLGLLGKDPVAREVATTWLRLDPKDDLHGGYVVEARTDGDRPLAVLVGADAAALAAARFELETFTPSAKEKEPRSVEFREPDEEGGVRIAPGRRSVRPAYRIRAAAGLGPGESYLDVAAAHANRMWVPPDVSDRDLALLKDHGVAPVAWLRESPPWEDVARTLAPLLDLQRRGVRRFALDWRRPAGRGDAACPQTPLARVVADALRPGGLEELLVIPVAPDGAGIVLKDVPEAVLGWVGPSDPPLEIARVQAEVRRKETGVPVSLVETWMEAAAGDPPRIPSLPRGRASDLGEALDGIVVLPGPASASAVAAAWEPPADGLSSELVDLLGACVQNAKDGATFLLESAACLEQTLLGRYADPPWLRGLPQRLRESAASLPATLLCRWRPEALTVDGNLREASWAAAPPWRVEVPSRDGAPRTLELRAVSDGHRLVLGLRAPKGLDVDASVQIAADGAQRLSVGLPPTKGPVDPDVVVREGGSGGAREFEIAFGHYALGGDPYPTRRFGFDATLAWRPGEGAVGIAWFSGVQPEELLHGPVPGGPLRGALLVVR